MDDIDDDFGDIYADVETRAEPSSNGVPDFTRLYSESSEDENGDGHGKAGVANPVSKEEAPCSGDDGDSGGDGNVSLMETDGSDSEDDLNIVLNDEDCQLLHNKGITAARIGESDDEDGDDCLRMEQETANQNGDKGIVAKGSYHSQISQYKYVRSHGAMHSSTAKGSRPVGAVFLEDNKSNPHKTLSPGQVAYPCSTAITVQSGYGFSLPWYRTILDINIDAFEQKPWRHPAADLTDFFNFDFDEESWKSYCKSMELIRQQTSLHTKTPVYSTKLNQGYEADFESEKVANKDISEDILEAGLGKIISPGSRHADGEARHLGLPKGRAIQVEGSRCERLPSTDVKRLHNRDSDVVIQITVQDCSDHSCGSQKGKGDDADTTGPVSSEDEDNDVHNNQCPDSGYGDPLSVKSLARSDGRCPHQKTSSVSVKNSVGSGIDHTSDEEGVHFQNNSLTSHDNAEVVEALISEEEFRRNAFDAIACVVETGSSDYDEIDHSSDSSLSGNKSEASGHLGHSHLEKFQKPRVKESEKLNQESVSDCEKYPFRIDSVLLEKRAHWRRLHSVDKMNAEHADHGYDLVKSNRKRRNHSPTSHRIRKVESHDVDFYDRKDILSRQNEVALHDRRDKFADSSVQTFHSRNLYKKDHRKRRDETDPFVRNKWDEHEYFHTERVTRVDRRIEENHYDYERSLDRKDMIPRGHRESRHTISKYSSFSDQERDACRSRKHEHLRKRIKDERIMENRCLDDFMPAKYERYVPFNYRERDVRDEKYERHLRYSSREDFDGRERCFDLSPLHLDDSVAIRFQDEYPWHSDDRTLPSRSPGDAMNGENWYIPPGDDVCNSRSTELYRSSRRQLLTDRYRENDCFDGGNGAYKHEDRLDQIHFEKRCMWESKESPWLENEFIYRREVDESYAGKAPIYYENSLQHGRFFGKHKPDNTEMLTGDTQLNRLRCKTARQSSRFGTFRSSDVAHRSILEQIPLRRSDPVDLVLRERKSHGISFEDERLVSKGKFDIMANKNHGQMRFKHFKRAQTLKVTEQDRDGEKWLDKFAISEHNDALEIEEGQIVTEEPDKDVIFERRHTIEFAEPATTAGANVLCKKRSENKVAGKIDNQRILEMRRKMEKRGERFKELVAFKKEPITVKKPGQCPEPQVDPSHKVQEIKQRPARKRRWG